ncbi:MAG TPA: hypothetical protein VGJ16_12255, partial [Pirellulales bacterium]
ARWLSCSADREKDSRPLFFSTLGGHIQDASMSAGASAGGAAGAAAAIAQAIKASGVLVRVEPEDFLNIVLRMEEPLVVHSSGSALENWFGGKERYLTSCKGLAFFAKSRIAIPLPESAEIVEAGKIWLPS